MSAHASFHPTRDAPLPPTKDGKALLARVAFLLRVIEPLAPQVDIEYPHTAAIIWLLLPCANIYVTACYTPLFSLTRLCTLTNRLIPVAFALLSHASEQVRRSAHAVIHSLLALAPVPLAQSLVPSYCRIALASALVDDVPVPSTSNNSQIADYLYERYCTLR